ncbi:unnamed protein product [Oppiella nova]|uniref:Uncharacterized protein n=1 Tax=Oppiella nova TaxID=334625 RepID=A0A7R9QMU9_9ACAR|nr:unnamed protein product [Oppiella nova]CAG2168730.1 unnamed protein product [Oppiella nova]
MDKLSEYLYLCFVLNSVFILSAKASGNKYLDAFDKHVSRECYDKIVVRVSDCEERHTKYWANSSALVWNKTVVCCLVWDASQCLKDVVVKECESSDKENVSQHFDRIIEQANTMNCSHVAHNSSACIHILGRNNISNEGWDQLLIDQTSPSNHCITELKDNQQYCGEQAAIVSGFGNKSLNLDYTKVQCCVGWLRMDCFNQVVREKCDSYEYNATHRVFEEHIQYMNKQIYE